MNEKEREALTLARSIIDYCQGDAWERECTKDDRERFDELYNEFFPKPKEPEKETFYCSICERDCSSKSALDSHLSGKKHRRKVLMRDAFEKFAEKCELVKKDYGTCKLDTSKFCSLKNCKKFIFQQEICNRPFRVNLAV